MFQRDLAANDQATSLSTNQPQGPITEDISGSSCQTVSA